MVTIKVKTRKNILRNEAVRGCWSCRSLSGKSSREVETARIQVARSEVSAQRKLQESQFT
jgi:hypothetical protein